MAKNKINFALSLLGDIVYEMNTGSADNQSFQAAVKSWKWSASELENMMDIPVKELFACFESDKDSRDRKIYNEVADWYDKYNF